MTPPISSARMSNWNLKKQIRHISMISENIGREFHTNTGMMAGTGSYKCQYDNNSQLIRAELVTESKYVKYKYFPDGKLREENEYSASGNLISKVKWQYSGGNAGWSKYDGDGDLISTCTITAGGKKRVVDVGFVSLEEEYDASGRLLSSILYIGGNNGAASEETYNRYNSKGDLTASVNSVSAVIDWSSESYNMGMRYVYEEYDKYGNWILRKSWTNY